MYEGKRFLRDLMNNIVINLLSTLSNHCNALFKVKQLFELDHN